MNLQTEIWALKCHAERANDDPSTLNLQRLAEQMTIVDNLIIKQLATTVDLTIPVEYSDKIPEGLVVMISPSAVLSVDNDDLIKDLIDRKLLIIGRI